MASMECLSQFVAGPVEDPKRASGFNKNCLLELEQRWRGHYTVDKLLIVILLEGYEEYKQDVDYYVDEPAFRKLMENIGTVEPTTQKTTEWFFNMPEEVRQHRHIKEWIEFYVRTFPEDWDAAHRVQVFPFQHERLHEWFTQDKIIRKELDTTTTHSVRVLNTIYSEKTIGSLTRSNVAYPPDDDEQFKYWFHTTNKESARKLVMNGIQLGFGMPECNFSNGDGFYLSETFQHALTFVSPKFRKTDLAIIVYKTEKRYMESNYVVLDFLDGKPNRKKEWEKIVKWNVSGRCPKWKPQQDCYLEYEESDYIRGPMIGNRPTNHKKFDSWHPSGWGRTETIQMCIRSTKLAEDFGHPKHIDGVIFFGSEE